LRAHILVVERDLDLVVVYRVPFEKAGYVLHWAANLPTARTLLVRPPYPDLMILNGCAPDAEALAFCREQRAIWPLLPIILTTTQPDESAAARAAGVDLVVPKPFYTAALLGAVTSLLPVVPPGAVADDSAWQPGRQTPA
jgi:DNA-binding response OmpR family regulator